MVFGCWCPQAPDRSKFKSSFKEHTFDLETQVKEKGTGKISL